MTTIVTKNGSGAPLASDLVQGELAVDLTNKRLYTEDSGGTVIEVGSNPTSLTTGTFTSTGIDDNATSTAITIDASENVGIGTATPGALLEINQNAENVVRIRSADGTIAGILFGDQSDLSRGSVYYDNSNESMQFRVNDQSEAMRIDSSGNVGIGTDTVSLAAGYTTVNINGSTGGQLHFSDDDVKVADFTANTGNLFIQSAGVTSFRTGGFASGDEAMRITSSGNVGIGTTSPATYGVDGAEDLVIGSADGNHGLTISSFNTSNGTIAFSDVTGATVGRGFLDYDHLTNSMAFGTSSTERMRIDSSGNVGIGTSSPVRKFHAEYTDGSNNIVGVFKTNSPVNTVIAFSDANSTQGDFSTRLGAIGDSLGFFTNGANERMRIDSSGNLLVGTTSLIGAGRLSISVTGNTVRGIEIQNTNTTNVNALVFRNSSAAIVGTITNSTTSTTYGTLSDYRLKENVVDLDNGIDRLKQIPVHRFNFLADPETTVDGFIAHEVQDVVPEAITGTKDAVDAEGNPEYQGIDQSKLVPLLTAALQEAVTRIETLEAEVAALKGA